MSTVAFSQDKRSISGVVVNAANKLPVVNASVFVNGTSRGAVTDANGRFYLGSLPAGSYELVISSVGFSTIVYPFSSDKLPLELSLELKPKAEELEPVTVEPFERDGWKQWGKFFTENFIGTSAAAKLCEIRNPKVLRFRYSKKRRVLEVMADKPLIIENRALGYRIQYQLEAFVYDWNARSQVFLGFSLFEDLAKEHRRMAARYLENRQRAYQGSVMHFIRSLYNNRLKQEGFEVQRLKREVNLEKQRVRKLKATEPRRSVFSGGQVVSLAGTSSSYDSLNYYQRVLMEPDSIEIISPALLTADSLIAFNSDSTKTFYFKDYLQVVSNTAREEEEYLEFTRQSGRKPSYQRSVAILLEGTPVTIDHNGMYIPPQDLFLLDYWAWSEKIAHLLPWDYVPDIP